MDKDTVEIALNPVSPLVPTAEGAVDRYLVRAYDEIASRYFEGGQWVTGPDGGRRPGHFTRP